MKAFVIAETETGARELCAGARTQADVVMLVAPGFTPPTMVADKAFHIAVPEGKAIDDAYLSVQALFDQEQPELVVVEPTRRMKSLAGRLAAYADTAALTDAIQLEDGVATSLYFGGLAYRRSKAAGSVSVVIASPSLFGEAEATGTTEIEEVAFQEPARSIEVLGLTELPASDVDLAAADVVVAGGRGFTEETDLELMRALAAKLGGECGCTRPLSEGEGWMPREAYIGVSGVMLSPKVYVGVGVSGQMQHMVGVNRANTVFAINKDKNAPIFKQCDYGIVGDLKTVLPALTAAL